MTREGDKTDRKKYTNGVAGIRSVHMCGERFHSGENYGGGEVKYWNSEQGLR